MHPSRLIEGAQELQDNGNWQLVMIFEQLDRQWDDGNPCRTYVRATTWFAKSDGPAGPGSEADLISQSFSDATAGDLDILSDDSIAGYEGHVFMLTDEQAMDKEGNPRQFTDRKGRVRNAYITTCSEYLGDGDDYEYDGKVQIVKGSGEGGAGPDPVQLLVQLFDGIAIADLKAGEAMNLVKGDKTLSEVKQVLGKALRGGLVKPRAFLIDQLISEGFASEEDGVFTAI